MNTNELLREQWKEANARMRYAEARLAAAWIRSANRFGGAPDQALIDEVTRLRLECDQRLSAVLDQLGKPDKRYSDSHVGPA